MDISTPHIPRFIIRMMFSEIVRRRIVRQFCKDLLFVFLGCAIFSVGIAAFILPEQIVTGGVSGVGALLYYAFRLPVGTTVLAINAVLLVVALRTLSRQFVVRTIIGVAILSGLLGACQAFFAAYPIITPGEDRFMHLLLGAIMAGIGLGIIISHDGSTGGTDIIVALLSKHTRMSFGRGMQLVDILIISSSYVLFHSVETIVYGLVFVLIESYVCDYVINGSRQTVQFLIISKRYAQIADAVNQRMNRGVTILNGKGWYSKQDVQVVMVLARKHESGYVFRIIKSVDPGAMVSQSFCSGVFGEGFDQIK